MLNSIFLLALILLPTIVMGQGDLIIDRLASSLILAMAGLIGLMATLLVFRNASKIGGGTLTKVYKFFAIGMLFTVVGVFGLLLPSNLLPFALGKTSGIFFMLGFAVMGVGANKILEAAGIK